MKMENTHKINILRELFIVVSCMEYMLFQIMILQYCFAEGNCR